MLEAKEVLRVSQIKFQLQFEVFQGSLRIYERVCSVKHRPYLRQVREEYQAIQSSISTRLDVEADRIVGAVGR